MFGWLMLCSKSYYMVSRSTSIGIFNMRTSHDDIVRQSTLVLVLLYGFFDIFIVLYLTNEITVTSDRLMYRAYESDWIEQPELTKKCFIIFCERLKQPQELVIVIYPLNLETFKRIVNGAYSMFNILKNFK